MHTQLINISCVEILDEEFKKLVTSFFKQIYSGLTDTCLKNERPKIKKTILKMWNLIRDSMDRIHLYICMLCLVWNVQGYANVPNAHKTYLKKLNIV